LALAFSVSVLWRNVAERPWLIWQQSTRDSALIALAFRGMAIPLHLASTFEL